MGHHAGISSANTRSVPTASATAKISCAYARPVQVNMVASNPGVLYRELRPPLDSGCDRHHKICDWYRVRAMPATCAKSKMSVALDKPDVNRPAPPRLLNFTLL